MMTQIELSFLLHLAIYYDRWSRSQDLEDAISSLQAASQVRSHPDNSTFSAVTLHDLACVLGRRYENTGRREDCDNAVVNALKATKIVYQNRP